ncbi:hypothetical protein IAT38_001541 [Cryptococcus sp. DSM 104549]
MAPELSVAECDRIISSPGSHLELEEKVILGRKVRVYKHLPPHYHRWLIDQMLYWDDRLFLSAPVPVPGGAAAYSPDIDPREHLTFREALTRALRLAAWMRSRGLGVGSRVVIGGGNYTGWVLSWIAVHLIGGVGVLLNAWLPPDQLLYCIKLTEPQLILVDDERAEMLAPFRAKEPWLPEMFSWSESPALPSVGPIFLAPNEPGAKEILDGKGLEGLGPESDGTIFFSSGTSGAFPKAVLSTQRMSLSNGFTSQIAPIRGLMRAGFPNPGPPDKTRPLSPSLLAVPLFHVTGCLSWLLRAFTTGSAMVMMRRWNVKQAVRLCVEEKILAIGGVPAIANSIMQSPDLPKDWHFDQVLYGGAPCSKHMEQEVRTRFPKATAFQGYGLTETCAVVCNITGLDYTARPESTGVPSPIYDLKIVDQETRKELPVGGIGIIYIKGVQIMKCYYNNEKATKEVIDEEGWFDSGDVGCVDAEGFLYIKDRFKDLIIRGGENIVSADVENAIYSHPDVDEVAAIPLPHPILGEVVGAIVSLRQTPGARTLTEQQLIEHARGKLPRYAVPLMVILTKNILPKNINGKILKKELKALGVKEWERRGGAKAHDKKLAKL